MSDRFRLRLPMMLTALLGVLGGGCTTIRPQGAPPPPTAPFSHDLLDRVQQRFVDEKGRVDYAALQKDDADLQAYYARLAAYSPDSRPDLFPTREHRLAYWLNAYNAAALVNVLRHYPIAGVADVKAPALFFFMPAKSGFFYFHRLLFGGRAINLYNLEHDLIRPRFADPRLHFALNCASVGCPRLPRRAFSAAGIDAELERETRFFIAEKRNFRIDDAQKTIYLSELFDWYEEDFLAPLPPESTVLDYIAPYLTEPAAAGLRAVAADYPVRFTPYDWSLNDRR